MGGLHLEMFGIALMIAMQTPPTVRKALQTPPITHISKRLTNRDQFLFFFILCFSPS
jgi:hypothetical protein